MKLHRLIFLFICLLLQHVAVSQTSIVNDTTKTAVLEGIGNIRLEGVNVFADISLKQAQEIKRINCSSNEWTIQSYKFSIATDAGLLEMNIDGNDFSKCAEKIKYSGKDIHFFLENIIVKNSKNEMLRLRNLVVCIR